MVRREGVSSTFERFTERARQVVVLAQEEARLMKYTYIGTEHILLGLLREEEGLAARVLNERGFTVDKVRDEITRIIGSSGNEDIPSGQIPFTPRAKKLMELALREALSVGHNYIGTEHLLMGLVRENEGVGVRILVEGGFKDGGEVREMVLKQLSGAAGKRTIEESSREAQARTHWLVVPSNPTTGECQAKYVRANSELLAAKAAYPDLGVNHVKVFRWSEGKVVKLEVSAEVVS